MPKFNLNLLIILIIYLSPETNASNKNKCSSTLMPSISINYNYNRSLDTTFIIDYSNHQKSFKFHLVSDSSLAPILEIKDLQTEKSENIQNLVPFKNIKCLDTSYFQSNISLADTDQDTDYELIINNTPKNEHIGSILIFDFINNSWKLSDFRLLKGKFEVKQNLIWQIEEKDTICLDYYNGKLIQNKEIYGKQDLVFDSKLLSWASNLRVRTHPKFKSEVAGKLTKDEEVEFLNQSVNCEVCLSVKDLEINKGEWLKIKKENNLEGWVYSPYLTNVIEISDYKIFTEENLVKIISKSSSEIIWQDSFDLFSEGIDYKFIQGLDYYYSKPYLILYPYSIEKATTFNTLIFNLHNKELIAKFIGVKSFYGISADEKYLIYANETDKSNHNELFIYSIKNKQVTDRIVPFFFHSWDGNQLIFYGTSDKKDQKNNPLKKEKLIWEGGISKNTGIFEEINR